MRARALEFGADVALDSADPEVAVKVRRETGDLGLAAAFDFAGVPAVQDQALGCMSAAGRLALVGITGKPLTISDSRTSGYQQQQVRDHYGSAPERVTELVMLAGRSRISLARSVSDVLPLSEAPKAVERLRREEGNPIRLVLRP